MSDALQIRRAQLAQAEDAATYRDMLNQYAADPVGQGAPLAEGILDQVITDLSAHPTVVPFLAFWNGQPAGFATCFLGYSTFKARTLLNIHDIAVIPPFRRRGIGLALIEAIAEEAARLGCCRITLEVREDNPAATALYRETGFDVSMPGGRPVAHRFLERPLDA